MVELWLLIHLNIYGLLIVNDIRCVLLVDSLMVTHLVAMVFFLLQITLMNRENISIVIHLYLMDESFPMIMRTLVLK